MISSSFYPTKKILTGISPLGLFVFIFFFFFVPQDVVGQQPNYNHDASESRNLDRFTITVTDAFNPQAKLNRLIIAVDTNPEGERFVLTFGNGIKRVGDNDGLINFIPNQSNRLSNPLDFAINSEGKFFVATNESNRRFIRVYSPEGVYLPNETLGNGDYGTSGADRFKGPTGLAFDNEDNLYVADHYIGNSDPPRPSSIKIYRKDASGSYKNNLINEFDNVQGTLLNFPYRLAVNSQGHLYMAELGQNGNASVKVLEFDSNFNPTQIDEISGSEIGSPGSIIIDNFDNAFIADFGEDLDLSRVLEATDDVDEFYEVFEIIKEGIEDNTFNVDIYNPNNTYRSSISSEIDFPIDLAISSCGTLYVNNSIFDGEIRTFFGQRIPDITIDFDLEAYQRSPGYDTEAPVLVSCPGDQDGNLTNGSFTLPDYTNLPQFTDNCDEDLGFVQDPPEGATITETTEVSIIAVDDNGNESEPCVFEVIIEEEEDTPPVFQDCPSDIERNNDPGQCGAIVTFNTPTATDENGNVSVARVDNTALDSGDEFPVGTTTIIFIADDGTNAPVTCSFDIVVADTQAPDAICIPPGKEYYLEDGKLIITPEEIDNGSYDNCGVASIQLARSEFNSPGTHTLSLIVTDLTGNSTICNTNIEIWEQQTPPEAVCKDFEILLDDNGQASISAEQVYNGNDDLELEINKENFSCSDIGENEVILTVTDPVTSFSSTCTATITVVDNLPPVANCVAPFTLELDENGEASLTVDEIDDNSTDNCTISSRSLSQYDFTLNDVGVVPVEITITDSSGLSDTCTVNVTVEDNIPEPPDANCINQTVYLNQNGQAQITAREIYGSDPALDGVSLQLVSRNNFECSDAGNDVPVTLRVADNQTGLSSECTAQISIVDDTDPTIICPTINPRTVAFGETGRIVNYDEPTVDDNCQISGVVRTAGFASGEMFPVGDTDVTYRVTDASGNTAECTFTVTVTENVDEIPPVFTNCPSEDITITTATGQCDVAAPFPMPEATDNSGEVSVELSSDLGFEDRFPIGEHTVTYTATDEEGNSTVCSFRVIVTEDVPPQVFCPDPKTETFDPEVGYTVPDYRDEVELSDNCTSEEDLRGNLVQDPAPGEIIYASQQISFSVEDVSGNDSDCNFELTLEEENAGVPCPEDITRNVDSGSCGAMVTYVLPTLSGTGNEITQFFPVGTRPVRYSGYDGSNQIECSFTVTVIDNIAPELECPNPKTANFDPEVGFTVPDYRGELTFSDNCAPEEELVDNIFQSPAPGDVIFESQQISFDINDDGGNSAACGFQLSLEEEATTDRLVARNDEYFVEDSRELFLVPEETGILNNDDYNSEEFPQIIIISRPQGAVDMDPDGSFTYRALDGFTGQDRFTYRLNDGENVSETATVILNISTGNIAPVAVPDVYFVQVNGVLELSEAEGPLSNDYDPDRNGEGLSFDDYEVTFNNISAGSIAVVDGVFTYIPNPDFTGVETITYFITDNGLISNETTITIMVGNEAPMGVDDYYNVVENGQLSVSAADGPLSNDVPPPGETLNLVPVDFPQNGEGVFAFSGGFDYTPNPGFTGVDTFTYTPVSGSSVGNVTTVYITVTGGGSNFTCLPDVELQLNGAGEAILTPEDVYTGDAGGRTFSLSQTSFNCEDIGENRVTFTYNDGNSLQYCAVNVMVRDEIAPTINCLNRGYAVPIQEGETFTLTTETVNVYDFSSDNCGIEEVAFDRTEFTFADLGTHTINFTVFDAEGNSSNCEFDLLLSAYTPEEVSCVNGVTLELNANGEAYLDINDVYTGDPSGELSVSRTYFTCEDVGVNRERFYYTENGEETFCEFSVTVAENFKPQVTVDNIGIDINQDGIAVLTEEDLQAIVTATDNCSDELRYEVSQDQFDCSNKGANLVNLTVTDESDNVTTTSFTVFVNTPPGTCGTPEDENDYVFVYPNPNNGSFKINAPSNVVIKTIWAYDMRGRLLEKIEYDATVTEYAMSLGQVATAVYVLRLSILRNDREEELIRRVIVRNL
ncbi:HYR domain-containing protein [Zunongwangia sp. F260]|uniref:HYR domain-containing protein n=1 Tax=Autumnicola lenta TaxID=3075593 RepID=A0ABU3CI66_9FLAO|nr:HYR domain-containing protein [Zunongwangia sp. F260]MDT0646054.1 HYR domain-containing protein [Zunongwangia sp. F260]